MWSCGCHGNCDLEWHGQKSELLQRSVAPSGHGMIIGAYCLWVWAVVKPQLWVSYMIG